MALAAPVPTETVAYFVGACEKHGVRLLANGKPVMVEDMEPTGGLH
jgi:hypothetical protein